MADPDHDLVQRIDDLVAEEHRLRSHAGPSTPLSDTDRARLQELEVRLDQLWDLLRQRRARREAGEDPGTAHVRPEDVVEHYQQ